MGKTSIEWTDYTFNPWRGCTKIAPGCEHCYAAREAKRFPVINGVWGNAGTRVRASYDMWKQPLKWNRQAENEGVRKRVFCASIADVFEDWQGPIHDHTGNRLEKLTMGDLRRDLFATIDATPHLDWLLLTKRPENIVRMWPTCARKFRPNVWLGTSVSEQATADRNIPKLLNCRHLSPVLFASYEPALGPVYFTHIQYDRLIEIDALHGTCGVWPPHYTRCAAIDWVIVGGESGPDARPFNVDWAADTIRQCHNSGVACFLKQLGASPMGFSIHELPHGMKGFLDSKGVDPKGGDWLEWPKDLRVRQFPEPTR